MPTDTTAYLKKVVREAAQEPRTSFILAITGEASTGELGYVLARDQWGHGYATEVARRLIVFGFNELGLRRITATCHPDNFASARVLEKAGMHFEKTLRDDLGVRGGWRVFAVAASDVGAVHSD